METHSVKAVSAAALSLPPDGSEVKKWGIEGGMEERSPGKWAHQAWSDHGISMTGRGRCYTDFTPKRDTGSKEPGLLLSLELERSG